MTRVTQDRIAKYKEVELDLESTLKEAYGKVRAPPTCFRGLPSVKIVLPASTRSSVRGDLQAGRNWECGSPALSSSSRWAEPHAPALHGLQRGELKGARLPASCAINSHALEDVLFSASPCVVRHQQSRA